MGLLSCNSSSNTARPLVLSSALIFTTSPETQLSQPSHATTLSSHTHTQRERERERKVLKRLHVCACQRTSASSEPCVSFSKSSSGRLGLKLDKFLKGERIKAQRALLISVCLQYIQLCADAVYMSGYVCVCVSHT